MSLLGALLTDAGQAATGGALGLVGNLFQGVTTYFNSKAQFVHDEAMADKQLVATRAGDADKLAQIESTAAGAAFAASQAGPVGAFASGVLTVSREIITFGLLAASVLIYLRSSGADQGSVGRDVLVMTSMAVAWHFGQKPASNFAARRALAAVTSAAK